MTKTDPRLVDRKELDVPTREDTLVVSRGSERFSSLTRETSMETREMFQRVKRSWLLPENSGVFLRESRFFLSTNRE